MTREEAIRRLRYIRMDYLGYPPFLEPIDMAIEALSADAVHIETYRELYEKYVELKHASADAVQGGRYENAMQKLREMPRYLNGVKAKQIKKISADELVRCKDCRHRDLFSCPLADNDFQKDDDYCSWGERRES